MACNTLEFYKCSFNRFNQNLVDL